MIVVTGSRLSTDLPAAAVATTTSSLVLAALVVGLGVGPVIIIKQDQHHSTGDVTVCVLGVRAGDTGGTKVLDRLASVLGATEEDSVGALGCLEGELVKGEDLAAGVEDAGVCRLGELEGADGELGDLLQVIAQEIIQAA